MWLQKKADEVGLRTLLPLLRLAGPFFTVTVTCGSLTAVNRESSITSTLYRSSRTILASSATATTFPCTHLALCSFHTRHWLPGNSPNPWHQFLASLSQPRVNVEWAKRKHTCCIPVHPVHPVNSRKPYLAHLLVWWKYSITAKWGDGMHDDGLAMFGCSSNLASRVVDAIWPTGPPNL